MSTILSASASAMDDSKPSMCLSPQDKLKGSTNTKASLAAVALRKKATVEPTTPLSMAVAASALGMDFEMVDAAEAMDLDDDLDLDLVDDSSSDHDMDDLDDAGWVSDDNLRALAFDDSLNQDIDWVAHDDVETSLKLAFIPSTDDVQDFVFDPSSFLSPLRGGLSFDDSDMSSSFAESLSVDTPPPSFGTTSHDAEKLLMSFDTMNFTIPSPTSSSTKKRASLFGKKETDAENATDKSSSLTATGSARTSLATTGSMSPSLKLKAGAATDGTGKEEARPALSKLSIPTPEFLGVLSITTPTLSGGLGVDTQKKIGSYSPEARRLRIQKFHEKRKNRTWKKSIKYDCRKKLADDRPRIKGRFVRVHDNANDVKEEDSCSATCSSNSSPAPSSSSSSLCGGSPIKVEPVVMPTVTPATTPVLAVALLAAQLQPVPSAAIPAAANPATSMAAVPTTVSAAASLPSSA